MGLLGIGIGLFVFHVFRSQAKAFDADAPARERLSQWDNKLKRLDSIQLSMRSDYEVMRDDQRRDAAVGFAANLGTSLLNTAASRYIPDRRQVTVERKTTRK